MKLTPEWERAIYRINRAMIKKYERHMGYEHPTRDAWSVCLQRIVNVYRQKTYKQSAWDRKLSSITSSWNVRSFQLHAVRVNYKATIDATCWRDCFVYALRNKSKDKTLIGWPRKMDTMRRNWADTSKQIEGGLLIWMR